MCGWVAGFLAGVGVLQAYRREVVVVAVEGMVERSDRSCRHRQYRC